MKQFKAILLVSLVTLTIAACNSGQEKSDVEKNEIEGISATADTAQQEQKTVFQKTLTANNITFEIETTGEGSISQLSIQPTGLAIDNRKVEHEIDGQVVDAVISDLNADGSPEILVFSVSAGSGSYGDVLGYSVNNGKSVSRIYFPELSEDKEANAGYMGHDKFDIVKNKLTRTFPLYKAGDANANPTGGTRQIQYRLKDGADSRLFVIDKVSDN